MVLEITDSTISNRLKAIIKEVTLLLPSLISKTIESKSKSLKTTGKALSSQSTLPSKTVTIFSVRGPKSLTRYKDVTYPPSNIDL